MVVVTPLGACILPSHMPSESSAKEGETLACRFMVPQPHKMFKIDSKGPPGDPDRDFKIFIKKLLFLILQNCKGWVSLTGFPYAVGPG
jgi:hypothetical protein